MLVTMLRLGNIGVYCGLAERRPHRDTSLGHTSLDHTKTNISLGHTSLDHINLGHTGLCHTSLGHTMIDGGACKARDLGRPYLC